MKAPRAISPAVWALPIVLIATAVVFSPALDFQFVFDDRYQIANNPNIRSWSYAPGYFRTHVWGFTTTWTNYYRPLFLVVLRVWESLVGLDPVGWHVLPIAVHLVNVGLVGTVVRKLAGDAVTGLMAAAVFAVHPAQIEAVGAVFGITDVLMAAWILASFLSYLRCRDGGRAVWGALSVAAFAGALLTKESAIVFAVVLVVYEVICGGIRPFPKEGTDRAPDTKPASRKDRVPDVSTTSTRRTPPLKPKEGLNGAPIVFLSMVVVVVLYFVVRHYVLGTWLGQTVSPVSWKTVVLTAPVSMLTFLRLLVLPYGMSSFYNSPYMEHLDWRFAIAAIGLMAIALAIAWWSRRTKNPLVTFAAIWAALGILPVLNLRLMQEGDFVHIRFLYVPCVAVAMLFAIGVRQLIKSLRNQALAVAGVVVALGIGTYAQIGFLHDNVAMFHRGVEVAPDNQIAKNNLADEYVKAGRIDEATALLDDNLRRHPNFWMSNYNRGYIAYQKQDWPEVDTYMGRAIANGGDLVDAYVYRGFALAKLGRAAEGEQLIREAIVRRPEQKTYHFVLGLVLRQEQKWEEALAAFEEELKINPSDRNTALHVADLRVRVGAARGLKPARNDK